MPQVTEEQLKEVFEIARQHRVAPAGRRDLNGVSAMMGAFSGSLRDAIAPAIARCEAGETSDIQTLLTSEFRCDDLRPGDFSREAFESLPGFQSLMLACQSANVAPRIGVVHRADYTAATEEDKQTPSAVVVVRIYPPQDYAKGFVSISDDKDMGMPLQNWTPHHLRISNGISDAPVKMMKPLRYKSGGMP
jgi:hypothetical protein